VSFVSRAWASVVAAVGILAAGTAALFAARRSGREAERVDHLEDDLERADEVDQIRDEQLDAAANRPRDRDELKRRMRNGEF
jgi:hypothetical protein